MGLSVSHIQRSLLIESNRKLWQRNCTISTKAKPMWTMFIPLFLLIFVHCGQATKRKIFNPVNKTHMEVHFKLPPTSSGQLNGFYSLHHHSCEDTICDGGQFETPHSGGQHLQILTSLSPCTDQKGIFVKLHTWNETLVKNSKPMNSTHMEVMFKLPPGSENILNGTYSIHHESCPGSVCGGGDFKTPKAEEDVEDDPFFGHGYSERHSSLRSYGGYGDQLIHIATGLSPCLDHQNITVKVYTKDGGTKKSKAMSYKKLSLKEIQLCNSCDESSRLSEDLATDKWCQSVTTRSRS